MEIEQRPAPARQPTSGRRDPGGRSNLVLGLARAAFSAAAIGVACWLVRRELGQISWAQVEAALSSSEPWRIASAIACLVGSYACLAASEYYAFRYAGHDAPVRLAATTAAFTSAVASATGFGLFTGAAIRLKLYGRAGVSARAVAAVVIRLTAAGAFAGMIVLGLSLLLQASTWRSGPVLAVGLLLITPCAAWFLAGPGRTAGDPDLTLGNRIAALASSVGDWTFSGLGLYALDQTDPGLLQFLAQFAAASLIGLVAGTPGAIGPLDAAILGGASGSRLHQDVAALVLYRVIFLIAPLILALATWLIWSLLQRRRPRQSHPRP